jgi:hypothetical protein
MKSEHFELTQQDEHKKKQQNMGYIHIDCSGKYVPCVKLLNI